MSCDMLKTELIVQPNFHSHSPPITFPSTEYSLLNKTVTIHTFSEVNFFLDSLNILSSLLSHSRCFFPCAERPASLTLWPSSDLIWLVRLEEEIVQQSPGLLFSFLEPGAGHMRCGMPCSQAVGGSLSWPSWDDQWSVCPAEDFLESETFGAKTRSLSMTGWSNPDNFGIQD